MPQVSGTVTQLIKDEIKLIQEKEKRSESQVISILLERAIKERNRKKIKC
jgi:hypothetical protein